MCYRVAFGVDFLMYVHDFIKSLTACSFEIGIRMTFVGSFFTVVLNLPGLRPAPLRLPPWVGLEFIMLIN